MASLICLAHAWYQPWHVSISISNRHFYDLWNTSASHMIYQCNKHIKLLGHINNFQMFPQFDHICWRLNRWVLAKHPYKVRFSYLLNVMFSEYFNTNPQHLIGTFCAVFSMSNLIVVHQVFKLTILHRLCISPCIFYNKLSHQHEDLFSTLELMNRYFNSFKSVKRAPHWIHTIEAWRCNCAILPRAINDSDISLLSVIGS